MKTPDLLPVVVTCGDPAGIGLEVIAGAWEVLKDELPFFVVCDPGHVPEGAPIALINRSHHAIHAIADGIPVLPHAFKLPATPGAPSPGNAVGVVEVIERAVKLVRKGDAAALCTAPIAKSELKKHAGFTFPGHTEFLAHLSGADISVMMLASDELKVVPATIHIPLSEVPQVLTKEGLEQTIRLTEASLRYGFGIEKPRVAVAGLNPHAGEGGLMGTEEATLIAPVCAKLRAEGMSITDPLSADTMFHAAARARYDVAIAMYHDQALIPIKTLAFDKGVNVTLGLPFPRTSPDHGTAFDIAGKGIANPNSMIEALRLARDMSRARADADSL